ncbi:MAG TPA: hypothetical protein VM870_07810 [Pyrinomonadaceae bacterium]|nr:hypothetical protein [Pyrinomonadaceae bacterium]
MKSDSRRRTLIDALVVFSCVVLTTSYGSGRPDPRITPGGSGQESSTTAPLLYADFESEEGGRPVSKRGGFTQLTSFSESPARPSRHNGAAGASPPAPELVRLQKDNPNRAAAFDYELQSPNEYAGVALEVRGQAEKDGKPVADDVSAYKYLSMQIYATGVPALRVEFQSSGQGVTVTGAPPQASFRIKSGFNTYRIPLNSLAQPQWVERKVNPKDVLKKLTSVSVVTFCDKCTPVNGTVVVDNIIFER